MKPLVGMICLIFLLFGQAAALSDNKVDIGDVSDSQVTIVQGNESDPSKEQSDASPWWEHFLKQIIGGIVGVFFALLVWRIKKRWDAGHE